MIKICCALGGILFVCVLVEPLYGADKTRMAVTNFNMTFLPTGVALKRGFFKEERLDVEIITA